jgi:hypothetical protein
VNTEDLEYSLGGLRESVDKLTNAVVDITEDVTKEFHVVGIMAAILLAGDEQLRGYNNGDEMAVERARHILYKAHGSQYFGLGTIAEERENSDTHTKNA